MRSLHPYIVKTAAVISCAALMTSLAACGNTSGLSGTQSIRFQTWNLKNDKYTPYFENLIAAFEKENPGTHIEWIDQPADGYDDKLSTDASAGQLPDVVNVEPSQAYVLAKAGAIMNISKEDPDAEKLYTESSLSGVHYKGHGFEEGDYGYPWYINVSMAYIDTSLFSKCGLDPNDYPKTMTDLLNQASTLHANCPDDYMLSGIPRYLSTFAMYGVDTMNADGTEYTFNNTKGVEFLDRYIDLFREGAIPQSALNPSSQANINYQGHIAYMEGNAYSVDDYKTNAPDIVDKLKVIPQATNTTPTLWEHMMVVSRTTKNKELSYKFARYVTNADNQLEFAKQAHVFPSAKGVIDDPSFKPTDDSLQSEAIRVAIQQINDGKVSNNPPSFAEATGENYLADQIGKAFQGQITAKEALDSSVKYANERLK